MSVIQTVGFGRREALRSIQKNSPGEATHYEEEPQISPPLTPRLFRKRAPRTQSVFGGDAGFQLPLPRLPPPAPITVGYSERAACLISFLASKFRQLTDARCSRTSQTAPIIPRQEIGLYFRASSPASRPLPPSSTTRPWLEVK